MPFWFQSRRGNVFYDLVRVCSKKWFLYLEVEETFLTQSHLRR